jgi:hypothetical protein
MTVDALVAWPPLSSTLNDGSLIHMPIGAGRSYIPILMGTANRADAEVMYSGGEGALLQPSQAHGKKTSGALS